MADRPNWMDCSPTYCFGNLLTPLDFCSYWQLFHSISLHPSPQLMVVSFCLWEQHEPINLQSLPSQDSRFVVNNGPLSQHISLLFGQNVSLLWQHPIFIHRCPTVHVIIYLAHTYWIQKFPRVPVFCEDSPFGYACGWALGEGVRRAVRLDKIASPLASQIDH